MKDDIETECMNELFGGITKSSEQDDDVLEEQNVHWRPVARLDSDRVKITNLKIERKTNEI